MKLVISSLSLVFLFFSSFAYSGYEWSVGGDKAIVYAKINKNDILKYTELMYPKYKKYAPYIRSVAASHGVPTDVVFLAAIESSFNEYAKSSAGAVGMWQFLKMTAIDYDLNVNSNVDERLNWKKSTVAAIKYIKWLSETKFNGDYETAILAYNYGVGNVHAIAIKINSTNSKMLLNSGLLPRETENHLIKFLVYRQVFLYLDKKGKNE